MQRLLLAFSILLIGTSSALAQVELNVYGGYMPPSKSQYSYYGDRVYFEDGGNFGVALGIDAPVPGTQIEISYMHFSTEVSSRGGIDILFDPQKANIEYYQIGVVKSFIEDAPVDPYGLFTLGASRLHPEIDNDVWNFAMNLGLGLKYFISDRVGIRVQARLLLPLYFAGGGFGCSIGTGGSGCGTGIGFGSEVIQGDFTGGLIFKLGE